MHAYLTRPIWQLAVSAQELASAADETQIQPEHLLAALLREPDGIATRVFAEVGALPADISTTLAAIVALRQSPTTHPTTSAAAADGPERQSLLATLGFSSRSERVLNYAREEAALLGHDRAGVEHLLLGLIREGEGKSGRTLAGHCITLERARRAVAHVKAMQRLIPPDPAVGRTVTYTYDLKGGVTA